MDRKRVDWQDAAKGIGIVLVVFGHVERGLRSAEIISGRHWAAIDFALYTFHMPLFMLISGMNVQASIDKGVRTFLRSKLLTIFLPYIIWSLIQGIVMVILSRFTNGSQDWHNLLYIAWAPVSPFWFLYAIFIFFVLSAFIRPKLFLCFTIIAFLIAQFLYRDAFIHQLLHFGLFFALGICFGRKSPSGSRSVVVLCTITVVCSLYLAITYGLENYNSIIMLPAAIGAISLTIWVSRCLDKNEWLIHLGRLSMPIYVMHIVAAAGTRILLARIIHIPPNTFFYLTACVAAGVFLPIIAYHIAARIGLLPALGLGLTASERRWIAGRDGGHRDVTPVSSSTWN